MCQPPTNNGTVLLVGNQIFVAMYIFELIFRAELSPVAVAHHIGSVIIAAAAVAISLDAEHQKDALLEFLLCLLWGVFDNLSDHCSPVSNICSRRIRRPCRILAPRRHHPVPQEPQRPRFHDKGLLRRHVRHFHRYYR